jgi:hypothetical protein
MVCIGYHGPDPSDPGNRATHCSIWILVKVFHNACLSYKILFVLRGKLHKAIGPCRAPLFVSHCYGAIFPLSALEGTIHLSYTMLNRKSSINALAPTKITQDEDGFESIDSYFPEEKVEQENRQSTQNSQNSTTTTPMARKRAEWRVEPSPVKAVEYEVAIPDDGSYNEIQTAYDHIETNVEQFVASPDMEDREIVFKRTIKPRPSITSSSPGSLKNAVSSRKKKSILTRKRSLLPDPLVQLDPEHGDLDDDTATRKSNRKRFAPLAFWKNEKVVYGRRNSASMTNIIAQLTFIRNACHCGYCKKERRSTISEKET